MSLQIDFARVRRSAGQMADPNSLGQALLSPQRHNGDVDPRATPAVAKGGLAPWQTKRALGYIEANLDQTVTIADLAVLCRLSISYFSVAFSRSLGITVRAYIMRRRIDRAKTMMMSTTEQLSRIAVECGFCDQAHLSRLFRRMTGSTPTRWRKTNRPMSRP